MIALMPISQAAPMAAPCMLLHTIAEGRNFDFILIEGVNIKPLDKLKLLLPTLLMELDIESPSIMLGSKDMGLNTVKRLGKRLLIATTVNGHKLLEKIRLGRER
jgi:hypothetical protein